MSRRLWTPEDAQFVREKAGILPYADIASHLGRTENAIKQYVSQVLCIRIKSPAWSDTDNQFLLHNEGKMSKLEMSRILGRDYAATRMQASKIGATKEREDRDPIFSTYFLSKGRQVYCHFRPELGRWFTQVKREDGVYTTTPLARAVAQDAFGKIPDGLHVCHIDGKAADITRDVPENYFYLPNQWNMRYMKQLSLGLGIPETPISEAYINLTGVRPPGFAHPTPNVFRDVCSSVLFTTVPEVLRITIRRSPQL